MTHVTPLSVSLKALSAAACLLLSFSAAQPIAAQSALAARITAPIANSNRVTLTGSRSPLALPANDIGAVPSNTKLDGITLVFSRTPAQQAALDALILAQQTPGSPLYHQWLTPDQFAARFGVADSDISAVEDWLQHQGFAIQSVARSRNRIVFSGTAGLVASAFGAPLHYFKSSSASGVPETHFAPASDLTLPAALGSTVQAVTNLSNFRPHPHIKFRGPQGARPAFTSSQSGDHYLTPGDLATIYDVTPAYNAGFTGSNQSIAIIGQSAVTLSDIANFQAAVNITGQTPQPVLVPGSGAAAIYTGDEAESDLDLEYSSTMAKGAQIFFVFTGSDTNADVFTSLEYAVDERIAPIISSSYGDCETDLGATSFATLNAILDQAATQGQTVISAAGDDGSTDCYGDTDVTITQQEALAVDFPASSQYVTGIGGTEFPAADVIAGNNTYFTAQGTTDSVSSALSYIPEGAWNDDATFAADDPTSPLGAGGGGVSAFAPRPAWQAGTIGGVAIASGSFRLVPDISFTASPINAPLAYCTSDTTAWSTGQVGSCTDGLRDASTGVLTVAGGTSFDAPSFAGMLALIEQSRNSTGEGVINSTLYTLAATPATYTSAFHDVASGGNQCLSGTLYCSTSGTSEYASVTGYDEATGLGSIDLFNLLTAWPNVSGATLTETSTTLSPATATPSTGVADTITITVGEINILDPAIMIPTGTVALTVDGAAPTSATTLTLVNGVATYTFTSTTSGSHVIVATYSGDTLNGASEGTVILTIGSTAVGSFTLAVPAVSVTAGASVNANATITPAAGYTGTVDLGLNYPNTLTNFCISDTDGGEVTITGATHATDTLTFYTSAETCNDLGLEILNRPGTPGSHHIRLSSLKRQTAANHLPSRNIPSPLPLTAAMAGVLALFGLSRRSATRRRNLLRAGLTLGIIAMLSLGGLSLTACSSSATATTQPNANDTAVGTYALTLTGNDSINTTQTASVNFNLTVN